MAHAALAGMYGVEPQKQKVSWQSPNGAGDPLRERMGSNLKNTRLPDEVRMTRATVTRFRGVEHDKPIAFLMEVRAGRARKKSWTKTCCILDAKRIKNN